MPHHPSTPHALSATVVLVSLLAASTTAHAAACLYRGEDASARVINASGVSFTPFPESLSDLGCERLRVVSGAINVYVLDASRNEMRSTRLTRGPLVPGGKGDTAPDGGGIFLAIKTVLEGGQRMLKGSSRSDVDYIQAAMPAGRLAEPTADLRIPLAPTADLNLKAVELSVGGKSVYRQTTPAPEIVLPASQLVKGSVVTWRVVYGPTTMTGQVEVVDRARLTVLRDAAALNATDEGDAVLRQLRLAASLAAEGFGWDAQQAVKEALPR